jgi:hypothetical protein
MQRTPYCTAAAGSQDISCSIHGEAMNQRENDGDTWYSHRLEDRSRCKGGCGNQPAERVEATRCEHAVVSGLLTAEVRLGEGDDARDV